MKTAGDLRQFLNSVDGKGYPAYKGSKGEYAFSDYVLSIDHVQGDPFAAPSKISLHIDGKKAGFPVAFYDQEYKKTALCDALLRKFGEKLDPCSFKAKGSGKSGLLSISHPGQEVLDRTACRIDSKNGNVIFRLEVGFPANGRSIRAGELIRILFELIPSCAAGVSFYSSYPSQEKQRMSEVIELAEDQNSLRSQLMEKGLAAFVANGAILPRQSGVSEKPMKHAVPFQSPEPMEVEIVLPNRGVIKGMGIKTGITLIVGGGYHGKSTLLEALEKGVYNHVGGDGREFVVTDDSAVKLRAEDGRSVKQVNISPFINNLPDRRDTVRFSTEDASGSTSQAASVMEAMESGTRVLLVDEDTSATNFMVRDRLMQMVVSRSHEPIIPFIERVRSLYEKKGISTILVAGSSGAYFHAADHVIQMDSYLPKEITAFAKEKANDYGEEILSLDLPEITFHRVPTSLGIKREEKRTKTKVLGKDSLKIDHEVVDLRYVEQIVDGEQIAALGFLLPYAEEHLIDQKRTLVQIVDALEEMLHTKGIDFPGEKGYIPVNLALPRRQEIFAAFNRCRSLSF